MLTQNWSDARNLFSHWLRDWLFSKASAIPHLDDCKTMMNYSLQGKGKHFRPVLHLICLKALGQPLINGRGCALALECIHTYSLIHDDLPCMDDDDFRRGKPSSHKKFGEAEAVLTGDALLTLAFELVAKDGGSTTGDLVVELAQAAGNYGMVGGQLLDLQATGRQGDLEELENIHNRKTGALISACVSMAGIRAHQSREIVARMRDFGRNLGLIFQIRDDILDVVAEAKEFGKTVGKDASQGKLTYPQLMGIEGAKKYLDDKVLETREELKNLPLDASELENILTYLANRGS